MLNRIVAVQGSAPAVAEQATHKFNSSNSGGAKNISHRGHRANKEASTKFFLPNPFNPSKSRFRH